VTLRRFASLASTVVVAIVVALAVPISQLRTVSIVSACCCPDPSNCHCPDHKGDHSTQPSIRDCHKTQQSTVTPQLPVFEPPTLVVIAPARAVETIAFAWHAPHDAPAPARPDAPS
jgi:hypothetical protein